MMQWRDEDKRAQLRQALEALDAAATEATETFKDLVATESKAELFEKLMEMDPDGLRTVVLDRVIAEQQRRGIGRGPNGH
jgi:hypothetical protein